MKIEEKKTFRLAFTLCLVLLIPFIYLAFFCHPIGDDLTYAWKGQNKEFWKALADEYTGWNGRYFSNLLVLHNPFGYGSLLLYRLVPIAIIFGIVWSAQHYFTSLFKNAFATRVYWLWGGVFALVFLFSIPDISEGLYWYTGAVSYTLGAIFLIFSFSLSLRKQRLLSLLFLFLGMGCSEVCMLFGLFVYAYQHFVLKQKNWHLLIAAFLLALVVYFAPGNGVRSSLFEAKHQFFHSGLYSLAQSGRFNISFFSIPVFLASIGWLSSLKKLNERSLQIRNSFGLNWKSSWLLLIIPIFIASFPAYWSTGILGQHRTINVACFFWIFAWFANLTVWHNQSQWKPIFKKYLSAIIFLLLLSVHFLIRKDSFKVIEDLIEGNHQKYSEIMDERWSRLENCSDLSPESIIFLPRDTSNCGTLDVLPLGESSHWVNKGYALFCDCEEIVIEGE